MTLTRNIAGYWLVRFGDKIWNTYTPDIRLAIEYALNNK